MGVTFCHYRNGAVSVKVRVMTSSNLQAHHSMHRATVITAVIAIAPLSLVIVAMTSETWTEGFAIAASLCVTFLVLYDWNTERYRPIAIVALAFAFAVWVLCAVLPLNALGFFGFALLAGIMVPQLPSHHLAAIFGIGGLVAAAGALYFVGEPFAWYDAVRFVVIPGGLTIFIAAIIMLLERQRMILRDLEQVQQTEAELAVMRERVRFASDLHDIQGHTLHVVNLKVELAAELLDSDVERARHELHEVSVEVENTIARTKELAHGQRRLNLSAELVNAKNLFEAAGVVVHVRRLGEAGKHDELLGQVLRESTTNILRHAQATRVDIELSGPTIRIINDGADGVGPLAFNGLAVLADRVAADGGRLSTERKNHQFVTAATFTGDTE